MADTEAVLKARLIWVKHFEQSCNAGLTCRRCGISRPTLRKWWRRFQADGESGLRSVSRSRHTPPVSKVTAEHQETILALCNKRRLGPKRIRSELLRTRLFSLSTATIWQVLRDGKAKPVRKPKRPDQTKEGQTRYSRPIPGEQVQMDTMKIRDDLYQFTVIDDCTRMRVLGLYRTRTAENTVDFLLERVLEELPFPVQRVQRLIPRRIGAASSLERRSNKPCATRRSSSARTGLRLLTSTGRQNARSRQIGWSFGLRWTLRCRLRLWRSL